MLACLTTACSEEPFNRKSTIPFSTCTTAAHELRNEFPQWRPLHQKACFRARARGGGPQSRNRRVSMWHLRRKARSHFFGLRNASGAARGPVKNDSFPYYNQRVDKGKLAPYWHHWHRTGTTGTVPAPLAPYWHRTGTALAPYWHLIAIGTLLI